MKIYNIIIFGQFFENLPSRDIISVLMQYIFKTGTPLDQYLGYVTRTDFNKLGLILELGKSSVEWASPRVPASPGEVSPRVQKVGPFQL